MSYHEICAKLQHEEASALARLFAQLNWTELRKYAADNGEADNFNFALTKLKLALQDAGFKVKNGDA